MIFPFDNKKGLAFEKQERRSLGLQGLLPAAVQDQKSQEKLVIANLNRLTQDLDKYVYLMTLLDK
jgi:malate dehydrogenase (oxaloacetate-decarboxylating)(NADP+)